MRARLSSVLPGLPVLVLAAGTPIAPTPPTRTCSQANLNIKAVPHPLVGSVWEFDLAFDTD